MGRPPGTKNAPGHKAGGRPAKSLDRGERQVVTSQMAGDILSVYARLGGEDFLYRWAKANPSLYVTNVLSRLMPAIPKDDPDVQVNIQNNNFTELEGAMRVAYALNFALNAQRELAEQREKLL